MVSNRERGERLHTLALLDFEYLKGNTFHCVTGLSEVDIVVVVVAVDSCLSEDIGAGLGFGLHTALCPAFQSCTFKCRT